MRAALDDHDLAMLRKLRGLIDRGRHGRNGRERGLDRTQAAELSAAYRHACTCLARLDARGDRSARAVEVRRIVGQAHGLLYRAPGLGGPAALTRRVLRFFLVEAPRTIRAERRLLALTFGLVYGLAALSFFLVRADLDLAPSLFDANAVANQIEQLEATEAGEPFRGNFTFGPGESPQTAGWIMLHNMWVGLLFFVTGLLPPLFLLILATNGMMLGTYTAVAAHWGQAGSISSILWCHGTLEIQAIILAGSAGLTLFRALVLPGPRTRRVALEHESRIAWRLFAPTIPLLFVAGMIEGFISPHAPFGVRMLTAVVSGALLLAWALFGGRERAPATPATG